jgi:3-amino-5-hydroxybenzoate synthase
MDSIRAISAKHGLRIISDAAHAHGARWRETSLARLCDIAIYSFQSGKLLTAGEGGMLLTESPAIAELAFLKSSCGRGRRDRVYDHCVLGTNMRMSEFHGAILEAQLKRFPAQLREREEAAVRLDRALEGMPGLQAQGRLPGVTTHSHYMYMVRLDEAVAGIGRDRLVDALVAEGVPAFRSYRAIPDLEMFREGRLWAGAPPETLRPRQVQEALHRHDTRNARLLGETSLWLHHAVLLGSPEVQRSVARAFAKVLAWEGQRKTVRQGVTSDVARPHA